MSLYHIHKFIALATESPVLNEALLSAYKQVVLINLVQESGSLLVLQSLHNVLPSCFQVNCSHYDLLLIVV
jgi:hypothetical protein